jgi:hypothetical protein
MAGRRRSGRTPGCCSEAALTGVGRGAQPPPPQDDHRITRLRELEDPRLDAYRELTGLLLLADGDLEKYNRAALRWHVRLVEETKNVDIRESQAVLALLTAIPANALAAAALAELLRRRRSCERIAEALVRWARSA